MRFDENDYYIPEDPEPLRNWVEDAMLDRAGLDHIKPTEPLIDGICDLDSLVWFAGEPNAGKSLLALDMACHIAQDRPWQGHKVAGGMILYVAGEGTRGLRGRLQAWEETHGGSVQAARWLATPVQADGLDWGLLIAAAQAIAATVVILDTQARMTAGMEENSSRDMGRLVQALDRLRDATKASVWPIHHSARAGTGLRGSTALEGAADTIIGVRRDSLGQIAVDCLKQKEHARFEQKAFRIVQGHGSVTIDQIDRMGLLWDRK